MSRNSLLTAIVATCLAVATVALIGAENTRREGTPTTRPAQPTTQAGRDQAPPNPAIGHRARPAASRGLSPKQVEEVMARMKTEEPDMHQRLTHLQKENPRAFSRSVERFDRFLNRLDALPPTMREGFKQQSRDTVTLYGLRRQYADESDQARKADLRGRVTEVVARLFDAEQKLKEFELQQFADWLAELRKEMAERADRREELIDARVEKLLETPRADLDAKADQPTSAPAP
ncbi:MAG: hypothetical protein HQ546_05845 [Planctomycetes bacterium]|nr:hypothetical protein [Planctomycetota bacterium]